MDDNIEMVFECNSYFSLPVVAIATGSVVMVTMSIQNNSTHGTWQLGTLTKIFCSVKFHCNRKGHFSTTGSPIAIVPIITMATRGVAMLTSIGNMYYAKQYHTQCMVTWYFDQDTFLVKHSL